MVMPMTYWVTSIDLEANSRLLSPHYENQAWVI